MPYGYNGKILHVNLTSGTWEVEEPPESFYRLYLGGSALAAYYLLKELPRGTEPLSPENVLVFASNVISGAPISGFSRFTIAAKSPLSNGFGESESGGFIGPELKFAGYDAVIVKGKAEKPVYIYIHDGAVEIRDAANVWGLEVGPAQEKIREEVGEKRARVACIGPAGENLVRFACVVNELTHVNGRSGMGAVMGSKNLKALVARGSPKNITAADPEGVKALSQWHNARIREHIPNVNMHKFGTPGLIKALHNSGILPTRGFREGQFEGVDKIAAPAMNETILKGTETCYACAVRCKRVCGCTGEIEVNSEYGGPEYETLAAFGSFLGIDNLKAIAKAHEVCNRAGMDTISAGIMAGFVMECCAADILTEKDLGRAKILYGDWEGMLWLLDKMAAREGIGDLLAEGVKRASEKLGKGAGEFSFEIKGLELPMHDPRGKTGVALSYAVSPTGADHIEAPHENVFVGEAAKLVAPLGLVEPIQALSLGLDKVRVFSVLQRVWNLYNSIGICNFVAAPLFALSFEKLVEAVQVITGWQTSLWELLRAGERTIHLARIFNVREGMGPEEDRLIRQLHRPLPGGPLEGKSIDEAGFHQTVLDYYELMGWTPEGKPTRGKMGDMSLEWAIPVVWPEK